MTEIVKTHVGDVEEKVAKKDVSNYSQQTRTPQETTNNLATVLERAIYNPEIDIQRIIQLKQLYDETQAREAELSFNRDFASMQPELPVIDEKGDANGRYFYARWEDINEAIKPVLQKYGFAINFEQPTGEGQITTRCILRHRDGHVLKGEPFVLPYDSSGNKNAVQSIGSSSSYGKRYTAMGMLNLQTTKREDDDGRAGGAKAISDADLKKLLAFLDENDVDKSKLCKRHGIDALTQLPENKVDLVIAEVKNRNLMIENKKLKGEGHEQRDDHNTTE